MTIHEIRKIAKNYGVKTSRQSKINIIREIQRQKEILTVLLQLPVGFVIRKNANGVMIVFSLKKERGSLIRSEAKNKS